jgi:hypothetical protein
MVLVDRLCAVYSRYDFAQGWGHKTEAGARPRYWSDMGFDHARMWTLADKCNGENPQWVAQLDVIAPVFEILPRFQVDNPSSENVWMVHAWNQSASAGRLPLRRRLAEL